MPSTIGRKVVVPLTNRSGGAVAIGDVVVIGDGINDSCFTTTTTANFAARHIGVAQEAIASLAVGRVLVRGYASIINTAASVTRDHYLFTSGVVKEASGSATRGAGAFGQVLNTGTDPAALIWGQPETGAGAPSYTGAPWASGTSFPGSPSTNDRFTRTDRRLDYFWNGTRWLCTCLHSLFTSAGGAFTNSHQIDRIPHPGRAKSWDIWMEGFSFSGFVGSGTHDVSNCWRGEVFTWEGNVSTTRGITGPTSDFGGNNTILTVANLSVDYLAAYSIESITLAALEIGAAPTISDIGAILDYRFVG